MSFKESETLELKAMVTADLCKEVIAFANTSGGTIYIGIADDGRVLGVEEAGKDMLKISNMLRDGVKPDITMFVGYEEREIDDKTVLVLSVQKGTDSPYYLAAKGLKPSGVYVRNATSSEPASDAAIRKMIRDTDGDSFEDRRSMEQNLTFKSAETEFEKRKVDFSAGKMLSLGLISHEGVYSNLALLLSDQCPHTMKLARFSGPNRVEFQDRRELTGSLLKQMEEAYLYLDMKNENKATFEGLYRSDKRDYPEEALREALLNSIVHRDYSYSASTLISLYDDRIEFISVGGIAAGIELDDILLGLSICRNPKLAAIFYRLELIEAYGTGLPKIMRAYEGTGLRPKIEVASNAFKITLPNMNKSILACENSSLEYGTEEEKLLKYIKTRGAVVRSDVETLLETSPSTATRLLNRLLEKGLIIKRGRGKNTKYTAPHSH